MKNYAKFASIILLLSMTACAPVEDEDAKSEEKGSKPAALLLKEVRSESDDVITNSIGMELKLIKAGTFMMGSPSTEIDRMGNVDLHKVTLTKSFYIQTTEVTQSQWKKVMGAEPWKGERWVRERGDCPAVYISWEDAQDFIQELNRREGTNTYRLPTEAEWEYACRAGPNTPYNWDDEMHEKCCWHDFNSMDEIHPVASKKPNRWGLYDMLGNADEWCSDRYDLDYYNSSPSSDPEGPLSGKRRVVRGGSWIDNPWDCRPADRSSNSPASGYCGSGFRVARTAD